MAPRKSWAVRPRRRRTSRCRRQLPADSNRKRRRRREHRLRTTVRRPSTAGGNQWSPNNDLNPAKNWDYVTGLVGFAYETPFLPTRSRTSSSRGS